MLDRRQFLKAAPAAWLAAMEFRAWAAEPAAADAPPKVGLSTRTIPAADLTPARLKLGSRKTCRILQFTDLHQFNKTPAEDDQTFADCQRQLERHQPDLVVLSGDLWQDNPQGRGLRGLERILRETARWGVPWTMCWGNHDLLDDYQQGHDAFEQASGSRYCGAQTHGDHWIEVVSSTEPAMPLLHLFVLNTNTEGVGAWQVNSLAAFLKRAQNAAPQPVPALAFFHVPIVQYETTLRPDTFRGVKLEGVSSYEEKGRTFPVLTAPRTIRACFCGHCHTNDYTVKTGVVDLVFGRSTGYAGYGGDVMRKGAKLIDFDLAGGTYLAKTVFADGNTLVASRGGQSAMGEGDGG